MDLLRTFVTYIERILFSTRPSEEVLQSLTIDSLVPLLKSQTVILLDEQVVTLLPYQNEMVKACVREAKFYEDTKASTLLAGVLADFLHEYLSDETALSHEQVVLVPIPLSESRKRTRGYNQVEDIVRKVIAGLDGVVVDIDILIRTRDTKPQVSLQRSERLTNMQEAFLCLGTLAPHTLYIILDDVATTGATLKDAKRALSCALPESSRIILLALSH